MRPPFDPVEFARQSELSTMPPTGQGPDLDPVVSTEATMEVLFFDSDTVPALAVAREDLEWFDLAQPVRDMLRHVDGEATIATVCARAKRSVEDGVGLVEQLVRDGVLEYSLVGLPSPIAQGERAQVSRGLPVHDDPVRSGVERALDDHPTIRVGAGLAGQLRARGSRCVAAGSTKRDGRVEARVHLDADGAPRGEHQLERPVGSRRCVARVHDGVNRSPAPAVVASRRRPSVRATADAHAVDCPVRS